jgi:predicted transglutaminase-like cysteine proteinase
MNRLPYNTDADLYGRPDYWASPLEFLVNGGDCEDYAIAKYVSLRMLGVPDEDMLITVGWSQEQDAHHAVLVVDADPDENGALPVVLNNTTNVVTLDAELAVATLAPLFSVNMTSKVGHF